MSRDRFRFLPPHAERDALSAAVAPPDCFADEVAIDFPSIDQIVAQAFGPGMPYSKAPTDPGQETRYRSIALGVQCLRPNTLNWMTYTGANAPIMPEMSPKAAFDRYFAGVIPTAGGSNPPGSRDRVCGSRTGHKAATPPSFPQFPENRSPEPVLRKFRTRSGERRPNAGLRVRS